MPKTNLKIRCDDFLKMRAEKHIRELGCTMDDLVTLLFESLFSAEGDKHPSEKSTSCSATKAS